ncbi:MAG TPA: FAD-linked oxidase C-terminal domain-containing protein, partial [Planctomycetaceae bacterium]|nr:FAD-linked oxidase C-terminal domain-containing protein [Planctomycetaceae bacterium]
MDVRQSRLVEDLAGLFRGELFVDPLRRALYASDASLYQIEPFAVACPHDADDVVTLVKYAAEHRLPLVPRGGGSTVAGGSLGTGIVVDFSRHLQRIVDVQSDTVRVEAGVTLSQLNRQLAALGRSVAPDPANAETTTIGGMIAVDAAGSRALAVGSMYDAVASLEVVTADAARWETGSESIVAAVDADERPTGPRRILPVLQQLFDRHARTIRDAIKPGLTRPGGGYRLEGVRIPAGLHLPRLLVGSEGTLALVTAATLRTSPLPAERGALVAVFDSLEAAVRAVPRLMTERPTACDLLDRRLLNLARDVSVELSELLPATSAAALIVEWTALSHRELLHSLERYRNLLRDLGPGCEIRREAVMPDDVDRLWALPRQVVPLLQRISGRERPLPVVEDILVPPAQLEEFVHRSQRILQQHGITASLYAHAPVGQVHLRPFLAPPSPHDGEQLRDLAEDLYQAAWELGGAIAAEHGAGLSRSGWMRRQAGPLYPIYQSVKSTFDPDNLLNPGKIVTDGVNPLPRDFRPVGAEVGTAIDLQLSWTMPQLRAAAVACNGCGNCRTTQPGLRMCPVFRDSTDEAASPRGQANLVRQCLTGSLPVHALGSPEFKPLADLCFNCKQCRRECPSNVDVPHLAIEAKAQHVAQFGVTRSQAWLTRLLNAAGLWNQLSPVINPLLSQRTFRWWLERATGLSQQRRLPPFARRPFLNSVRPPYTIRPTTVDDRTVVYFVDYFANHHDPELGWACVRVLEKQGLRVYVPPQQ